MRARDSQAVKIGKHSAALVLHWSARSRPVLLGDDTRFSSSNVALTDPVESVDSLSWCRGLTFALAVCGHRWYCSSEEESWCISAV